MKNQKTNPFRMRHADRRTLLILGDFVVGLLALGVALVVWSLREWLGLSVEFFQQRVTTWFYFLPIAWLILLVELYDIDRASDLRRTLRGIGAAALFGSVLYLVIYFSVNSPLPRVGIAVFLVSASILTALWRWLFIRVFTASRFLRRVLLMGAGKAGNTILEAIGRLDRAPFHLVGIIDDDPNKAGQAFTGHQVIGTSADLLEIVDNQDITDVVVAISGELLGTTFQVLLDVQERGVEITRMPVLYEELFNRVPIEVLEADWILRSFVDQFRQDIFYRVWKRIMDIGGGIVGVMILGMLLPFVGLATLIESGRPVFYKQIRLGRGGAPYEIIKFRTMKQDAEADGEVLLATEDDDRATKVGRFLRKTHIDEIPQFINVLTGQMSLVGPRSERPSLVEHYRKHIPFYRARLLVKPGVTGWAQVNFGYAGTIEETKIKLEYDLYYIKHRNMILDIITILRTPGTMIGFRGQ